MAWTHLLGAVGGWVSTFEGYSAWTKAHSVWRMFRRLIASSEFRDVRRRKFLFPWGVHHLSLLNLYRCGWMPPHSQEKDP